METVLRLLVVFNNWMKFCVKKWSFQKKKFVLPQDIYEVEKKLRKRSVLLSLEDILIEKKNQNLCVFVAKKTRRASLKAVDLTLYFKHFK